MDSSIDAMPEDLQPNIPPTYDHELRTPGLCTSQAATGAGLRLATYCRLHSSHVALVPPVVPTNKRNYKLAPTQLFRGPSPSVQKPAG